MKIYKSTASDGKVTWGIRYQDEAGKDVRRIVADTRKQAEAIGAKLQIELREGKYFDRKIDGKTTLGALVEKYKEHFARKDSFPTECGHLRAILEHFGPDTLISKIDVAATDDFRLKRLDAPSKRGGLRSPSTINRELECLRRLLYFAIKRKQLRGENPVSQMTLEDEPKGKIYFLEVDQANKLIEEAKKGAAKRGLNRGQEHNPHLAAIILVALYTGMRRSNVLQLRWSNVDIKNRTIHLPDTKSGESLNVRMNEQLAEELSRIPHRLGSDYVFANRDGKAYKRVDRAFDSAVKRAGIPSTHTFHCLRHSFVTWALNAGQPIHGIAKVVGHSTTRMTEIYGHLMKDTAHEVVNSLPVLVSATL